MNSRNLQYKKMGITAFLVVACSMLFYFVIFRTTTVGRGLAKFISVMNPLIYGFAIAYLLDPLKTFLENSIYKIAGKKNISIGKRWRTGIRVICISVSIVFAGLVIYALISSILPELINSLRNILLNYQNYVNNVTSFFDNFFKDNKELDAKTTELITKYAGKLQEWLQSEMTPRLDMLVNGLTSSLFNVITFLKNFFLGLVISIYILLSQETLKARFSRFMYAVFNTNLANRMLFNLRFVDEKFGGFVIGKLIDSAIIGLICYVCCRFFNFPYAMLISVVIGVTNIIPFFGPFIGAVPATVLIFVIDPLKALIFIIFILVLQQFDGNFLGPRILGSSVGVSSFMVIVAILVGSGFFGVTGMIIGVPICAIIVAVIQSYIIRRADKRGLPTDVLSYRDVAMVNPNTMDITYDEPVEKERSLYDWIKYRDETVRKYPMDIAVHSWERTLEQIKAEDAIINGTIADRNTSQYFDESYFAEEGEEESGKDKTEEEDRQGNTDDT